MSTNWIILLIGIALGAIPAWMFQGARLDAQVAKYELFVEQVKSVGELAEAAAKQTEEKHKQLKEKSDAENKLTIDTLRADIKRLRNQRPSSGFVPPATPGSSRPDRACFDRAELVNATGRLVDGVRGIADEGSEATVNLNTAKTWAQQVGANQ